MKAGKIRVVGSVYGNNDDVGGWSCLEPIVSEKPRRIRKSKGGACKSVTKAGGK